MTSLFAKTTLASDVIQQDRKIKKGESALYDGFLVPRYHYEQYSTAMDVLPKCSDAIKKCGEGESSWTDYILPVVLGGAVGYLAGHSK